MLEINSIKNGIVIDHIKEGVGIKFPEKIKDVIKCKNPRCITSTEANITHRFYLVDDITGEYRCEYCDNAYDHI